jgi:hypothetical protein
LINCCTSFNDIYFMGFVLRICKYSIRYWHVAGDQT